MITRCWKSALWAGDWCTLDRIATELKVATIVLPTCLSFHDCSDFAERVNSGTSHKLFSIVLCHLHMVALAVVPVYHISLQWFCNLLCCTKSRLAEIHVRGWSCSYTNSLLCGTPQQPPYTIGSLHNTAAPCSLGRGSLPTNLHTSHKLF
jgi:hypothetical protein